jgi:tetratricopeptide (TPR) repeat protein
MTALGHVSRADVATTVASALERSGSRSQAREQLKTAIATATTDREQTKLHQRAGGLALAEDDLDDASEHFQAALEIARASGAHGRAGQVLIRMVLLGIMRGDLEAAREHLVAAARAWKAGGAVEPTAALMGELQGLQRLRGGVWADAAQGALELMELAAAPDGAPVELQPLRRELGLR